MDSFIHIAETKRISIVNDVDDKLSIFADKEALMTIIRNLLDNALKFSPEGVQIKVKSSVEGNKVRLDVIDEGMGIDPNRLNILLTEDFIKSTQGTAMEKGSGLGLHIVKNLLKKLNGELKIESILGKGSTFSVFIPN